jgi:hypothetical protein
MSEETAFMMMPLFVETLVPLRIHDIKKIGGISQEHLDYAAQYGDMLAGPPCEDLMYKPDRKKDRGNSKEMINRLTRVLAIMAFLPGGVTFMNLHFEIPQTIQEATS